MDLSPRGRDAVAALAGQDLTPLSDDELVARIAALRTEIGRVEAHREQAARRRREAEDIFRR